MAAQERMEVVMVQMEGEVQAELQLVRGPAGAVEQVDPKVQITAQVEDLELAVHLVVRVVPDAMVEHLEPARDHLE
jgi:hypothetical protein